MGLCQGGELCLFRMQALAYEASNRIPISKTSEMCFITLVSHCEDISQTCGISLSLFKRFSDLNITKK